MFHLYLKAVSNICRKYIVLGAVFAALLLCAVQGLAASSSIQLNRVIAVVNGELITMHDLQQHAMPEIIRRGLTGGDRESEIQRYQVFNASLDTMIMDILYRQEAERYKVAVDDGEVENELRRLIQSNNMEPEEFERQIAMQGMTLDELRKHLRDGIMRQRLISAMVARKAEVTPEEVEEYYYDNINEFSKQDSVEFSIITLGSGSDPDAVYNEIASGKISFADAARKYSEAPTAAIGGSMGNIAWSDLSPAWNEELKKLGEGETSAPIVSSNGALLLHVDALHAGSSKSFEDVEDEIENFLRESRMRERYEEYSSQLRSRAVVEIKI